MNESLFNIIMPNVRYSHIKHAHFCTINHNDKHGTTNINY